MMSVSSIDCLYANQKQGLRVIDQNNLRQRLRASFANGRGSIRVLVLDDDGAELVVLVDCYLCWSHEAF